MNDDFIPEPYRKGKNKESNLKPWQSKDGEKVTQTKQRCWDGFLGCEEYKSGDQFNWHARICNQCVVTLCNRFGMDHADADYLIQLLWQDRSLFCAVTAMKAAPDKIQALRKSQEFHIPRLWKYVKEAGSDMNKINEVNMTYRKWFHTQAGV